MSIVQSTFHSRGSPVLIALIAACGESSQTKVDHVGVPETVTFAEHVAPIVYEHCAYCHRPGGHAPFSLLRYEDARTHGVALAAATKTRRMPPWLPEPGPFPLIGDRRLSMADISLIEKWVKDGMPEGDVGLSPPTPSWAQGWELGTPDLVVTMPDAYVVPPGVPDQFRNFVIPVPISSARWVRAVDLRPGEGRRVVHHAVINIDRTRSSRREDARDPTPGYDGMFAGSEARPPEGFFLGWTPGKIAYGGTEGMAWRLEPGTDIVLQLHLRSRDVEDTVQGAIGLYFTDRPPTHLSYWVALGSRRIDIPAGSSGYTVEDGYALPVDVTVFGIYPHAHFLGKEIEATADLPDGTTLRLLDIKSWDFNQQDAYRFAEPIALARGSQLKMRISYDNTDANPFNPNQPPKRVTYGPASDDEMANLFIQVLVRDSADLRQLSRDFTTKYQRDLKDGLEFLVEAFPDNAAYHSQLAGHVQIQGQLQEAKQLYRRALELRPGYAPAWYGMATVLQDEGDLGGAAEMYAKVVRADSTHVSALYNLGSILQTQGKALDAAEMFSQVIRLEPTHANAHNNLGSAMIELGRPAEAIEYFQRTLALEPRHADALNNLGNLLRDQGRLEEAIARYRSAVEAQPKHGLARFNLGQTLIETGRAREGLTEMRQAAMLMPRWAVVWATLAWTLATHPEAAVRDPVQAVNAATRAAELTEYRHPVVLDALAAAYATQGQFNRALEAARRGIQLATTAGDHALAGRIESRLQLYQLGVPYRTPSSR